MAPVSMRRYVSARMPFSVAFQPFSYYAQGLSGALFPVILLKLVDGVDKGFLALRTHKTLCGDTVFENDDGG